MNAAADFGGIDGKPVNSLNFQLKTMKKWIHNTVTVFAGAEIIIF